MIRLKKSLPWLVVTGLLLMAEWAAHGWLFSGDREASGWGLNSQIRLDAGQETLTGLLGRIGREKIVYLRQGIDPNPAAWPEQEQSLRKIERSGKAILGLVPEDIGQTPYKTDDLRPVYAAARRLGTAAGNSVAVWENFNEPDLAFDRDLPDASTARMKAVYLGLKDSLPRKPPVLLPSLGLAPGVWFARAERNGLLAYGDGFNFHYYSHARDFGDAIRLVQEAQTKAAASGAMRQPLPVWVTEIGINCVPLDALGNADGRKRQAEFLRETARTASGMGLAAFLPFAYRDKQEGFNLYDSSDKPYPGWDAYLSATRSYRLDSEPKWIDQEKFASRVILQWVPDAENSLTHKVSGAYRFLDRTAPLTGELRIYSFAQKPVGGVLRVRVEGSMEASFIAPDEQVPVADSTPQEKAWSLALNPGERKMIRVRFDAPAKGYARSWLDARWTDSSPNQTPPSLLSFGVETAPQELDFSAEPCDLHAPVESGTSPDFQAIDDPYPYVVTSITVPWIGLNGLKIENFDHGSPSPEWTFRLDEPSLWPGQPPMAISQIRGLPATGFIRLTGDHVWGGKTRVRVDLVDTLGQRFSIFENCGMSYFQPSNEVWLNLADFHRYFWGRFVPGKEFDPAAVREIQLRFYFNFLHDPVNVRLDVMKTPR